FLQAGMVRIREVGAAIVGQPKSGKTSLALALLSVPNVAYIADNDLAIIEEGRTFLGLGWPRSLCLRSDTAGAIAKIFREFSLTKRSFVHPYNGGPDSCGDPLVHVLPFEAANMTGCDLLANCTVDAFIFPIWKERRGNTLVR